LKRALHNSVGEPVAGIILAAGEGSRYRKPGPGSIGDVPGEISHTGAGSGGPLPKQLLPWRGRTLVWQVAQTALEAGLAPVVVVGGSCTEALRSALADLPVEVIHNPGWRLGPGTSVGAGVRGLPSTSRAALFLLADQPRIPAALLRELVEVHSQTSGPIVAPWAEGRIQNPVLFDRALFPQLMDLKGEVGGRALFSAYPVMKLDWEDVSVFGDIDTPEDYARAISEAEILTETPKSQPRFGFAPAPSRAR